MNEINYILHGIAIASMNENVRGTDSFFFFFWQRDTAYRMIPRCNVESVGVVSLTNLHFFADQAESESSIADREE